MLKTNIIAAPILALARYTEKASALLRGKGFGSFSVNQEVSLAVRALGGHPKLAIDVGGNRGDYAAGIRAKAPQCEIIVFEPSRYNVDRLGIRFAADPLVTIEPFGLSDRTTDATLFTNEPGSGAASLSKRNLKHFGVEFDQQEAISLLTFDQYWETKLASRPIDLLKLDIEGHELNAMRGAHAALKSTAVLQFEFGGCNIDSRTYFQDLYYFLSELGFALFRITPIGPERVPHYTEDTETFITTNFLAVRDAP